MADEIYGKLYDRLFAEQEKYVDWLLSQPRIEIMRQSYEFAMREDILMIFENEELEPEYAKALYYKGVTLEDLFHQFEDLETNHMQTIRDMIEDRAKVLSVKLRKEADKCPILKQTKSCPQGKSIF